MSAKNSIDEPIDPVTEAEILVEPLLEKESKNATSKKNVRRKIEDIFEEKRLQALLDDDLPDFN